MESTQIKQWDALPRGVNVNFSWLALMPQQENQKRAEAQQSNILHC